MQGTLVSVYCKVLLLVPCTDRLRLAAAFTGVHQLLCSSETFYSPVVACRACVPGNRVLESCSSERAPVHALVQLVEGAVEVHAAQARHQRQVLDDAAGQVHQHGLAAAHAAVKEYPLQEGQQLSCEHCNAMRGCCKAVHQAP